MIIITLRDACYIFIVSICFSWFAMIHRTVLPSKYSSVLQMEEDEKKTLQSTVIRILYLMLGTMFFHELLGFSKMQLACGIFLTSFLNVWPAIVQHRLLKLFKDKMKWMLLLRYVLFVLISVLISILTIDKIFPLLRGEESIYFFDNQGVSLLFWLFTMVIPVSAEQLIVKYSKVIAPVTIDSFREELYIMQWQLKSYDLFDKKNRYLINEAARQYDLSLGWINTILKLERHYRGNMANQMLEYILCRYFPNRAIEKDISVGPAQIKISTAQKVEKEEPEVLTQKLVKNKDSIFLCAKYIRYLINEYFLTKMNCEEWEMQDYEDVFDYVACEYMGGKSDKKEQSVLICSSLLRNVVGKRIYYSGSDDVVNYYVKIWMEGWDDNKTYKTIQSQIASYAKILKELYIMNEKIEFLVYCRERYNLDSLRCLAENYGLKFEVLDELELFV